MSFEAIYNIAQAEAEGKAAVTAAEQKAKGLIAEAEKAGKERDAALEHRIAKTLAGYEASHLENQREEAEA